MAPAVRKQGAHAGSAPSLEPSQLNPGPYVRQLSPHPESSTTFQVRVAIREPSTQTQGLPTGNIPYSNYTRHYLQTNKGWPGETTATRDKLVFAAQVDTQSSQSWEGGDRWVFRVHCPASLDFSVTSRLTKGTVSNARCTGSGGPFYSLPPICLVALDEAEGGCGNGS